MVEPSSQLEPRGREDEPEPNIYGTDGYSQRSRRDTGSDRVQQGAIMYRTPRSRATNQNESQYMSSVPDQTSL
jgi:hypothetical protein